MNIKSWFSGGLLTQNPSQNTVLNNQIGSGIGSSLSQAQQQGLASGTALAIQQQANAQQSSLQHMQQHYNYIASQQQQAMQQYQSLQNSLSQQVFPGIWNEQEVKVLALKKEVASLIDTLKVFNELKVELTLENLAEADKILNQKDTSIREFRELVSGLKVKQFNNKVKDFINE